MNKRQRKKALKKIWNSTSVKLATKNFGKLCLMESPLLAWAQKTEAKQVDTMFSDGK